MIKVITNHPVAIDSDDHLHPDGVHLDNHYNINFVSSVESYYNNQKINLLDLGCAGGRLVVQMLQKGHFAVGLEGSDHCVKWQPDMLEKFGKPPAGYQNWQNFGNKNLFTCDITYDYEIRNSEDKIMEFDLITSFDVMEHFYEERIDRSLEMVVRHLKPNGIFVANIALFRVRKEKILEHGFVDYHKSLFTKDKWLHILSKHFKQIEFPFACTNRNHPPTGNGRNLVYAGMKL